MTEAFVRNIEDFVNNEGINLVSFEKWQRKDDVTQKYLRRFTKNEGVLNSCARSVAATGSPAEPIHGSWNPLP